MRNTLLCIAVLMVVMPASAEAYYDVDANSSAVEMNSTVRTYCDQGPGADGCPVSRWTLTLRKPADAKIIEIESSAGKVEDYENYGDKVIVKTSHEEPTESETVRMYYRYGEDAEEIVEGLFTRSISLPAFSNDENSGRITVENLISADIDSQVSQSTVNETVKYSGSGPLRARLVSGQGAETRFYEFFPEKRDGSDAYRIAAGTLGFGSRSLIPVAIMPNKEYNKSVNHWSAGQFFKGAVVLREESNTGFTPILAHETVHALNEQRLDWNTRSSWFDEGVAKHVEHLARKASRNPEKRNRELFGDAVHYYEEKNGKRYRYTLPSKGEREVLWRYYRDNRSFMKHWNSDSPNREFGYAYSELVVKNHVMRNGSLNRLYERLEGSVVESNGEKWSLLSSYMDLTPCNYDSRERFDNCLDSINEYDYPVYSAEPGSDSGDFEVSKVEVPNVSKSGGSMSGTRVEVNPFQQLYSYINSILTRVQTRFLK